MSHIVTLQVKVYDPVAVAAACRRLGLGEPVVGTAELYSSSATGLLVQLPGWHYPVVIDTRTGNVTFDDYQGRWGDRAHLDLFLQRYAVEKAKLEARQKGCTVREERLECGSIRLQIMQTE